jgi:hypothetical protein
VVWFNPLVYKPGVNLLEVQRLQNRIKREKHFGAFL